MVLLRHEPRWNSSCSSQQPAVLQVIRSETTHDTSLVLLFGQLWPDFRIQLTVNQ